MAIYVKHSNQAGRGPEERGRESFRYGYLPKSVQRLLQEAFSCYTADLHLAFAVLCRRTVTVAASDPATTGGPGFERLYEDAVEIGRIEDSLRAELHEVLFGSAPEPDIDADAAAVLIEIVRDMLEQRYVRAAKLRRAIRMRRLFANDAYADEPGPSLVRADEPA